MAWVVSDFDDCQIVSSSLPKRRKAVCGTKRTLSSISQETDEHTVEDMPWLMKYAPKSLDDLIVAKPKITELVRVLSQKKPSIILLYGPPGSGKSIMLRCVASSLGYKVREWNQPSYENKLMLGIGGDLKDQYDTGIARQFCDFILNSNSYESLLDISTREAAILTVVEEIPAFKSEFCPETMFHELLRQSVVSLHHPLCFILTSNAPNADPPGMSRLFPQRLRDELNIFALPLNPIPSRTLAKAIKNILVCEKVTTAIIPSTVNEIIECSGGDMRLVVNQIQFMCQKSRNNESKKRNAKERRIDVEKKSKVNTSRFESGKNTSELGKFAMGRYLQSEYDSNSSESHSILLFRALGRVLYCKRNLPTDSSSPRISLPYHLSHFEADHLTFDPVKLIRQCPVPIPTFVGFLQYNVTSFYSNIDDLAVLADRYLSFSDLLFNQWENSSDIKNEIAGILAVLAVVNCNSSRRKSLKKDSDGQGSFRPLHAPPNWNTCKMAKDNLLKTRKVLPDFLAVSSSESIADYMSFSGNLSRNQNISKRWLGKLRSINEFSNRSLRSTILTASASFEDVLCENGVHTLCPDSTNAQADEDEAECLAYNNTFLETLEEYPD